MDTLKSIFRVASANIFNLGSSFILGFILPIYISTYDFGMYREYTLYITFIYIFNLGFNDGIYIKYGGKDKKDVDQASLRAELRFVRLLQVLMFIGLLVVALLRQDILLFYLAFASYFMNIIQFHKNFLQATGEFALYSKLNMFNTVFTVVLMLATIFVFKSQNYPAYIFANVLALLLSYGFYEVAYYKNFGKGAKKGVKIANAELANLFKVGMTILLSNMMVTFVANIGSWVVNIFYTTEEFAQYSFSTSLLNIILLVVNAVSLVFYNLIAKDENQNMLKQLKIILLLLGMAGGIGYFVFNGIITHYIAKYIPSLAILSITFISIPYLMVSNVIFNNIYKTRNNKKDYLKDMLKFLGISIVLIGVVTLITNQMVYIAIATTAAYFSWYLIVTRFKFTYLKDEKREMLLIISHVVAFWMCVTLFSNIVGMGIYILYTLVVLFFYRKDLLEIKNAFL